MVLSKILQNISVRRCSSFKQSEEYIFFSSILARLFYEVIAERYSHSFQYLIFAIIEDQNSMHAHDPNGNIRPFADVLRTRVLFPNEL